jgi:iron(III) transport system substrate-binding protein
MRFSQKGSPALRLVLGASLALALAGCGSSSPRVVIACAQDREFAEPVFAEFTRATGLPVAPSYDTEADKSVSLYVKLVQESGRPRYDVFWNNEILSTIRLQRQGLLLPYRSPAAEPYPAWTRPADGSPAEGTWQAFAERARVLLVDTQLVAEADRPRSLLDLTQHWKGRVALAKPQFGTSATHAACLFEVLGPEAARRFYHGLRQNDVQIAPGNKQVAEGVGRGQYAVGLTDTDDALAEVEAGRPVALVYPDRDGHALYPRLGTLFIPNTLAILRGGPNPAGAEKLVDYLLSPEVEGRLAESASHQIPLNPNVTARLPAAIETRHTVKAMEVDFQKAAELWEEVQTFLRDEFARP